jgi:hypothetical protein
MTDSGNEVINVRKPIRILHFSDGELEIFDDEDQSEKTNKGSSEEKVDEVGRHNSRQRRRSGALVVKNLPLPFTQFCWWIRTSFFFI